MKRWKSASCAIAMIVGTGCVASSEELASAEGEVELGGQAEAVQTDPRQYTHYNVATSTGDDLTVTGAVHVPLRDANGVQRTNSAGVAIRGSCGVTFVSPRYAITAAHCVDGGSVLNPLTDVLTVEQYDISAVNWNTLWNTTKVNGAFPNYTRAQLGEHDGYRVTRYTQCKVVRRCGNWGPRIDCDMPADVALLRCADRPRTAAWINVAKLDQPSGMVEMPWFHEVVDMVLDDPGPAPVLNVPEDPTYFTRLIKWGIAKDRYDHYTRYDGEPTAHLNYHYVPQQLLPLRSTSFRSGDLFTPRRRSGDFTANRMVDGDFEAQPARALSLPWRREGTGQGVDIGLKYEYQGSKNGFVWAQNGWNALTQDVTVEANKSHVLTAWLRNSQNFTGGYFGVRNADTNQIIAEQNFGAIGKYKQLRVQFNPGNQTRLRVFVGFWGPGADAWVQVDEVRLHGLDGWGEEEVASTFTDLFGCHGTSGSGVLQRNAQGKLELLGPVSRGGVEMSGLLCLDGTRVRPGGRHLAYTRPEFVRELARTAYEDISEWYRFGGIVLKPGIDLSAP